MTEILGKDLDKWEDSLETREPFNITESKVSGPQFLTGSDFIRSARINPEWKMPIAIPTQAQSTTAKIAQPLIVGGESAVDSWANFLPNLANLGAQYAIEIVEGDKKEETVADKLVKGTEIGGLYHNIAKVLGMEMVAADAIAHRKEMSERIKSYNDAVELLNTRDFPLTKYARRVLANTTNEVETRRIVRELYNQSRGIDSEKWYNQAGAIVGAMVPTIMVAKGAASTARAFGAGRIGAVNIAQNVAKGFVGAQMAGEYAEETAADYLRRTGDTTFENFTAKDASGLGAMAYGAIGAQIEFIGGIEPVMAGALSKVGLRSGLMRAGLKIGGQEAGEEFLQGITETLMRKIDGTSNKTWGEGLKEALNGAVWGLFIGGTLGTGAFQANRRNLVKGIKAALPNINETQATLIADAMIDSTAETVSQDPVLRNNLRQKIALMYKDSDIDNKDNVIDATTDLEYGLIAMDSAERGIDIAENDIFSGEVNELGWFRKGIPEARRTEIQQINDNIVELKTQLEELNKAQEKDWEKIEEVENKLAQANQYVLEKLSDLARDDANAVRRTLQDLENKYVAKEKEKAWDSFEATQEQKELAAGAASYVFDTLSKEGFNVQMVGGQGKKRAHGSSYLVIKRPGAADLKVRIGVTPIGTKHSAVALNLNAEKLSQEEMLKKIRELIKQKSVKSNKATDVNFGFEETMPMFQEQFDLADENARLDDIYPAYEGETIEVDGKERTVYNSNGDRIAKSAEALRNFYKWFGDSKVVDSQGRPLVVYHGTKAQFEEFAGEKIGQSGTSEGVGFYFTNDRNIAAGYGDVMSVYLKLEHPVYAYAQVFLAEDYDGDLDIMEANAEMIRDASMQVLEDLKAKGYEFYDETTSQMADIYTETDYDSLVNTIEMYIKDGIKAEDYDENKLYNDIREAIIKEFGFDGFKTKRYNYSDAAVYVALMSNQIKSVDNRGTYSSDTGNIYLQNRVSGGAPATYRGAYIPQYRFIQRANRMDASTLSHELAHDWFEVNFAHYRSGEATKDFMRAWGALEKALGVAEDAKVAPRKASEAFARAYEGWIMNKSDWTKAINIEDKDRDAIIKLMQDYQNSLRDIYQDLTSAYFKDTWGKLGELKPELVKWFDRVTQIESLDTLVERGEMTEEAANQEKLNRAIDTVIEATGDEESKKQLQYAKTLNDTTRYEVEGGNKNALQRRIGALAQAIDENNMLIKENYDTRRDMLEVAKQADNFVRTRLDDALAIINGQMAEQEGLFKEDIYTALERLALENGDLGLLDELRNSEIANRLAKELGQRVAGFRNWNAGEVDVFSAIKSLDNSFNKALQNKKAQAQLREAEQLFAKAQAEQDKLADKQLEATLKDLECK